MAQLNITLARFFGLSLALHAAVFAYLSLVHKSVIGTRTEAPPIAVSLVPPGEKNSATIQLTMRLLEQLKETMPRAMVSRLFSQMAEEMAAQYRSDLEAMTIEQRLDVVTHLLSAEGFSVEWERKGPYFQINEKNCPYYHVGQNHPEVCSVDQTLISTILNIPAQKIQCLLHGDNHCTYIVPHLPVLEEQGI